MNIAFDGKFNETCEFKKKLDRKRTSTTEDGSLKGSYFVEGMRCFINPNAYLLSSTFSCLSGSK